MNVWLVLPLKSLRESKTRLAQALDSVQRSALIDRLLMHTLAQAAQFPGLKQTLLVSHCEEARARARAFGASAIEEDAPGLNAALETARRFVREQGETQMLVVPCDLPLLRARDLRCVADACAPGNIALAPDRFRKGTNGICFASAIEFDFAFGPDSYERHLDRIAALGLRAQVVERPALAFDLDTPDDLAQLEPRHLSETPSVS